MTDEQIEKLIYMNQRLNLLLGYAMSFVMSYKNEICATNPLEKEKYKWLCSAIENLIYLEKPLPPMP